MSTPLDDRRRLVSVFRSSRYEDMYLYVDRAEVLARVPAELLERFGRAEKAMDLLLTPERRLARADAGRVLECIRDQGYYLQLPPLPDEEIRRILAANDKLQDGR